MIKPEDITTIEVELSNVCPLACPMCLRKVPSFQDKIKDSSFIDIDNLLWTLKRFPNLKNIELVGTISEPTTHPEFLSLVRSLKKLKLNIFISTNANTKNDTFWKELGYLLTTNDIINFAIDGSTQEVYQNYRINGKLDKVLKNAELLIENSNCWVNMQNIQFKFNQEDKEKVTQLAKDMNFSSIEYLPCGEAHQDLNYLLADDLAKEYQRKNKMISAIKNPKLLCQVDIDHRLFISYDEKLFICNEFAENSPTMDKPNMMNFQETWNCLEDDYNDRINTECCNIHCTKISYHFYAKFPTVIINFKNKDVLKVLPPWNITYSNELLKEKGII